MSRKTASQPLTERYASSEMSYVFSQENKFRTWRRLWIALAEAERELGLPISEEQIAELRAAADEINYEVAEAKEREVRHDVMSHIHAFGEQAPGARGIIHLGATSAYVADNTDVIQMRDGLRIMRGRIVTLMSKLRAFAWTWRGTPTVAFTHFQPAQLTTVGKRATLWLYELLLDYRDLIAREESLELLGVKGATGTQASFLRLFDGDEGRVLALDRLVAEKMGFESVVPISGQTYTRKVDSRVIDVLAGFAQSASKFAYDIRLLQHLREIEEPFEKSQVGSSAMAYKRNPMRSERIDSLARHLIVLSQNPALTAATQWFERTLDDSANRRITIPETFLSADAIALVWDNVVSGLVVHEAVIAAHVERELPFMATENVLMECVRRGGDRQQLHERIRVHSMAATEALDRGASRNDLLDRIAGDEAIGLDRETIEAIVDPREFVGLAPRQVEHFLEADIDPILEAERDLIRAEAGEVRV